MDKIGSLETLHFLIYFNLIDFSSNNIDQWIIIPSMCPVIILLLEIDNIELG